MESIIGPTSVYYWLSAFVLLSIVYFVAGATSREETAAITKKIQFFASNALLILGTIFVATNLFSYASDRAKTSPSVPVLEADKAELSLKLSQALKATESLLYMPTVGKRGEHVSEIHKRNQNQAHEQVNAMVRDAQKVLDHVVQSNPNAPSVKAKYIIVTHELDEPNDVSLDSLDHIDRDDAHKLAKALKYIYGPAKPDPTSSSFAQSTFETLLPKGYYRETALLSLFQKAGMKAQRETLQAEVDSHAVLLLGKLVGFCVFIALMFLAGVVVIVVQLFFLKRNPNPEEVIQIRSPVPYGFRAIFGVFIAWESTQLLLGLLLNATHVHIVQAKQLPIMTAALTAGFYLLANAPAFFYIYLIALRPHKLPFLDSVKVRTRVAGRGPAKLVLYGFLTWVSCFPAAAIAFLIAAKFFHSEGSSNPIIALVMEAARSGDIPTILMFYFTLGVLAPVCEETLFRGFLYTSLRQYLGVFPCLLITGALFAGVHMDAGGFFPLFALGFMFGCVVEKTKSIIPSMIAHGLWNSGAFTVCLLLFGN